MWEMLGEDKICSSHFYMERLDYLGKCNKISEVERK